MSTQLLELLYEQKRRKLITKYSTYSPIGCYPFQRDYLGNISCDTNLILLGDQEFNFKVKIKGIDTFSVYIVNANIDGDCLQTIPNNNGYVFKLPMTMLNSSNFILRDEYRKLFKLMLPYIDYKIGLGVDGVTYSYDTLLVLIKYNNDLLDNKNEWKIVPNPEKKSNNIIEDYVFALSIGIIATASVIQKLHPAFTEKEAIILAMGSFSSISYKTVSIPDIKKLDTGNIDFAVELWKSVST